MMWLRLRERMRALLGQMPGGTPFEGTSSFKSPSMRDPRSLSPGFGAAAAASPSPVVSSPAFSPGQAFREEVRLKCIDGGFARIFSHLRLHFQLFA